MHREVKICPQTQTNYQLVSNYELHFDHIVCEYVFASVAGFSLVTRKINTSEF